MNLMDVLKNRGIKINFVAVIAVLVLAAIAVTCLTRRPADTTKQTGDKSAATIVKTEKAKPVVEDDDNSFDNTSRLFKKFKYVGNSNSKIFHVTDGSCPTADKMNPKNMVKLSSKEQARKEGYEPCEVCNP